MTGSPYLLPATNYFLVVTQELCAHVSKYEMGEQLPLLQADPTDLKLLLNMT